MSEPTKEELLDFMRKHGPEKVDSITDTESAIRHFRCTSKIYKEQRDQYKTERDSLIDDIAVLKANKDRYRKRAENAMDYAERSQCEVLRLERQNAEQLALLKQFRKLIDYKLTLHQGSSMYREYRSKLDQLGVK